MEPEKDINSLQDTNSQSDASENPALILKLRDVPALILALSSTDHVVRYYAAITLWDIADASAIPALVSVLKDPSNLVRGQAAAALAKIAHSSVIPESVIPEIGQLFRHQEYGVQEYGVQEYGAYEHTVYECASYALACIGKPAVPELILALSYCKRDAEIYVAKALGAIGCRSAVPVLIKRIDDQIIYEKTHLVIALAEITIKEPSIEAREFIPSLKYWRDVTVNKEERKKCTEAIKTIRLATDKIKDIPLMVNQNVSIDLPMPAAKPEEQETGSYSRFREFIRRIFGKS